MRILITGGSGFLASHALHRLLKLNHVLATTTRYTSPIRNPRIADIWDKLYHFQADVRNPMDFRAFKPEIVIHAAAFGHVGDSFKQVAEAFDTNAKGSANVIDAALEAGAKRIIYISSSEVYGDQGGIRWGEELTPRPQSPYAIAKYAGELYARSKGVAVLRPFNMFGPWQTTKAIIPELIVKCIKGEPILTSKGEQTREFNPVWNVVDGIVASLDTLAVLPLNLCCGQDIAIRDLVKLIHKKTRSRSKLRIGALPYRVNEIWRMRGEYGNALRVLGWKPRVSFEVGLDRTIAWYRKYLRG